MIGPSPTMTVMNIGASIAESACRRPLVEDHAPMATHVLPDRATQELAFARRVAANRTIGQQNDIVRKLPNAEVCESALHGRLALQCFDDFVLVEGMTG